MSYYGHIGVKICTVANCSFPHIRMPSPSLHIYALTHTCTTEKGLAESYPEGSWKLGMVTQCRTRMATQPKSRKAVLFYNQVCMFEFFVAWGDILAAIFCDVVILVIMILFKCSSTDHQSHLHITPYIRALQLADGKADKMSLHGGCPVLEGQKWVRVMCHVR